MFWIGCNEIHHVKVRGRLRGRDLQLRRDKYLEPRQKDKDLGKQKPDKLLFVICSVSDFLLQSCHNFNRIDTGCPNHEDILKLRHTTFNIGMNNNSFSLCSVPIPNYSKSIRIFCISLVFRVRHSEPDPMHPFSVVPNKSQELPLTSLNLNSEFKV